MAARGRMGTAIVYRFWASLAPVESLAVHAHGASRATFDYGCLKLATRS